MIQTIYEVIKDVSTIVKRKHENTKLCEQILQKISSGEITACRFCSGFVDHNASECKHCFHPDFGYMGGNMSYPVEEYIKLSKDNQILDYTYEGIYIGRYSRGNEVILSTTEDGKVILQN